MKVKNPVMLTASIVVIAATIAFGFGLSIDFKAKKRATLTKFIGFARLANYSQKPSSLSFSEQRELSLMAGETYDFTVLGSAAGANSWNADFGRITGTGNYTAPSFIPPGSSEVISYANASGQQMFIDIHIRPNPSRPEFNFPLYIRETTRTVNVDGIELPAFDLIGGPNQSVLRSGDFGTVSPTDGSSIPVLEIAEVYLAPRDSVECRDLVPIAADSGASAVSEELVSGQWEETTTVTPMNANVTATIAGSRIVVDKTPKSCKVVATNPWPSGKSKMCNQEGTYYRVRGQVITISKEVSPPLSGTIKPSASIKKRVLEELGFELDLNFKYTFVRTLKKWTQNRTDDLYICRNGRFVFLRQEACLQEGLGELTTPSWVSLTDEFRVNGRPNQYDGWRCR